MEQPAATPQNKNRIDWSNVQFSPHLQENIALMERIFEGDSTLVQRQLISRGPCKMQCALFYLDGMVAAQLINQSIVEPILRYQAEAPENAQGLASRVLEVNKCQVEEDVFTLFQSLFTGDTIIFIEGDARPVLGDTKGFAMRAVNEPDNEKVLQGPREGFTENLVTNLSLIRRKLKTPALKFSFRSLGKQTHTMASLCYIDGVCDEAVLQELQKRLDSFDLDSTLDTNYLIECCQDSRFSPFPTMGITERPDIVAAKLLEGRVALVLDGTPVAITVPHLLMECFQSNDDYYLSYYYTSLTRVLRILGFLLTILGPAVYLALVQYHVEMVPTRLLLSIGAATEGVPFPALAEALILLIIFEILKETGTRTPSGIGQTLSIVGGLILGQAAVNARFVSAPMVIIIAFAGTTALMVPKLKTVSLVLRFVFLFAAASLGLYGIALAGIVVLLHLCGLASFGIPYLTNLVSARATNLKDVYVRFPWFAMKKQGRFLAGGSAEEENI